MLVNNLVSIHDMSVEDIIKLFKIVVELKENCDNNLLKDKVLGIVSDNMTLRSKLSFEISMIKLGGHTTFIDSKQIFTKTNNLNETSKMLSKFIDVLVVKTNNHDQIIDLAYQLEVPVINGGSSLVHPCQALADLYTVFEEKGELQGLKMLFIGVPDNVANSLMYGCAKVGMDITVVYPSDMKPNDYVITKTKEDAQHSNSVFKLSTEISDNLTDYDIIYYNPDKNNSIKKINNYRLDEKKLSLFNRDVLIMHRSPLLLNDEIDKKIIESSNCIIFEQTENRLHLQKALLNWFLKNNNS